MEELTLFELTKEQAIEICEFYDLNPYMLADWQIHELLDRLIDEATSYGIDYPNQFEK